MSIDLPGPIDSFVQAENSGDVEAVAECFAPYGTVRDEDRYYEGRPAIKAWTAKTQSKYRQTVRPLEIRMSNGNATLKAELSGDFLDQQAAIEQQLRGAIHFQAEQIAVGRLVIEALKEPAKI